MVYNIIVTTDHPFANKFALNLNELVKNDGGKGIFPEESVAISLDKVERSYKRAAPLKTMDVAIGVIARRTEPDLRNKRMLLCEFRFNYKNRENISKTELEKKITNSQSMLRDNYEGQIDQKCYFLFNSNIIQQMRYIFSRIYNTRTVYRIVSSEEDFMAAIFKIS